MVCDRTYILYRGVCMCKKYIDNIRCPMVTWGEESVCKNSIDNISPLYGDLGEKGDFFLGSPKMCKNSIDNISPLYGDLGEKGGL